MFKRFTVISCLLGLLLFQSSAHAQSDTAGIAPLLNKNSKMLGDAVALVWKDGKIIYQKQTNPDFNGKMQAPIAAASQWLTAAVVMSFVDEGKISLDDPVGKYLPIFNSYMKRYLTVRQCLMHETGIDRSKGLQTKISFANKYKTLEEHVNALAAKEIIANSGEDYFYGSYGPAIAARVIEVVGKRPFERLVMERILRPCKMRSTNFDNDGKCPNPGFGAVSTANDYLNFLIMLLNDGMFEGKKVLSPEAIKEMRRAQLPNIPVKYQPEALAGFDIALGQYVQEKDASGNGTVICSPSLTGTWPYIDLCRKYVAILFVSKSKDEVKKEIALQFKEMADATVGDCR